LVGACHFRSVRSGFLFTPLTALAWSHRRAAWGLAAVLAAVAVAPSGTQAAERFPATAAQPTAVLAGAHYVDAAQFFSRYGLERQWLTPARRARFSSTWTKVELEADKREMLFNGIRVFLGDPVLLHRQGLWLTRLDAEKVLGPLLKPEMYADSLRVPRTIVVDAGHGGQDTGTRNTALKLDEKGFTLDVARRLAEHLDSQGFKVIMTRTDDRFVSLAERAEIANRAKADLFVSIHFNSVEKSPEVRGSETYILTPRYQRSTADLTSSESDRTQQAGNRADAWSMVLGYQMQRNLLERLGTFDRGLKRARFAVLRLVECPAVLVEAGYLSNHEEALRLATPEYRAAIAEAVANGIAAYAVQVSTATR
jgi:N-acetylmuramoyl-L-alanine amidase